MYDEQTKKDDWKIELAFIVHGELHRNWTCQEWLLLSMWSGDDSVGTIQINDRKEKKQERKLLCSETRQTTK